MRLVDTSSGLSVRFRNRTVGTLARTADGRIAFQYAADWLADGFSINPYSLPLTSEVFVPDWEPFGGIFGAFHDSLPDGWGALLLDRMLRREGFNPGDVDLLDRLTIVGSSGRGALTYHPQTQFSLTMPQADLDQLASLSQQILADQEVADLDVVYAAGGSSGGARPKAFVTDGEGSWIVKFPSRLDPSGIGRQECEYALAAKACGIEMPDVRLFPSRLCEGYFGTRRFDIDERGDRVHMLSASAIVEVSHRVPSLDYESLFQISAYLGCGAVEAKRIFRLMCFNVFAHNRDDHSNNFTWLCDGGAWRLSPAYDLTYSDGMGGNHATAVLGNGRPGMRDVLDLAREVGLPDGWVKRTAVEIERVCVELLGRLGLR